MLQLKELRGRRVGEKAMTWDRESDGTSLCFCKELKRQGLEGGGRQKDCEVRTYGNSAQ